jgi:putative ABC transport system permease protein
MNRDQTTPVPHPRAHPLAGFFFRALFLLAPRDFRYEYGRAMMRDLTEKLSEEEHLHGAFAASCFFAATCRDIVAAGFAERRTMIGRDLVFALRSLRKTPLFTVVVIFTLALAIGANAAVFSVLRAVVLSPLPYNEPDRLVTVYDTVGVDRASVVSLPDAFDVRAWNHVFSDVATVTSSVKTITGIGPPRAIRGFLTTWSSFAVLGVRPELGRFFDAGDEPPGAGSPVVISDRLWHEMLGGSANAMGRSITLDARSYRIIGVAPPGFLFPNPNNGVLDDSDFWELLRPNFKAYDRGSRSFNVIARLRSRTSITSADADLSRIAIALQRQYPGSNFGRGFRAVSFVDVFIGQIRPILIAAFAGVLGVLVIACANVANLLLSRSASRDRELAIRFAIGATRGRVISQVLTETFLFAAAGGILGLALCAALVAGFIALQPAGIPRLGDVHIDAAVIMYTFAIVILCTLTSGLVPALALSRPQLADALKAAGRSGDATRGARARNTFVLIEIAISVALVITSGLIVRSFDTLAKTPLGITMDGVLVGEFTGLSDFRYGSDASRAAFYRDSVARIDAIPGVNQSAWVSGTVPIQGDGSSTTTVIQDLPRPAGQEFVVNISAIAPQYFGVLGIQLIGGRAFTADDRLGTAPVAIVDRAFAQTYFHGNALGKWIEPGMGTGTQTSHRTIVGIVDDVRRSFTSTYQPSEYIPLAQVPRSYAVLVVRTHPNLALDHAIANAAVASDPLLATPRIRPLRAYADDELGRTRLSAILLGSLAAVALFLAVAGIYAVVSFGVAQRTQEFGIRMALGSSGSAIVRDVVLRASRLVLAGIVAGVALAGVTTRLVADQLYGIGTVDPITYAGVVVVVSAAALVAAFIPALRATRVDPVVALRYQ